MKVSPIQYSSPRRRVSRRLPLYFVALLAIGIVLATAAGSATVLRSHSDTPSGTTPFQPVYVVPIGTDQQPTLIAPDGGSQAFGDGHTIYAVRGEPSPDTWQLRAVAPVSRVIIDKLGNDYAVSRDAATVAFQRGLSILFAQLPSGATIGEAQVPSEPRLLAMRPRGSVLFSIETPDDAEQLWTADSGGNVRQYAPVPREIGKVGSASWLGADVIVVGNPPGLAYLIHEGGAFARFTVPRAWYTATAPSGDRVAVDTIGDSSSPEALVIADARGQVILERPGEHFVDWSPDGARFATVDAGQVIRIFSSDGTQLSTQVIGSGTAIGSFHWATDGQSLIGSSGPT